MGRNDIVVGNDLTTLLVIDDLLGRTHFQSIKNIVFGESFDWYFHDSSHLENIPNKQYPIELHGFTHIAFSRESQSNYFPLFQPVVYGMVDALGLTSYELVRIKLNLTLNVGKQVQPQIHSDMANGYTAVYYFDDSDGDTLFFSDGEVTHRQPPKANSIAIFDSNIEHSAQLPLVSTKRCVMNINIVGL